MAAFLIHLHTTPRPPWPNDLIMRHTAPPAGKATGSAIGRRGSAIGRRVTRRRKPTCTM